MKEILKLWIKDKIQLTIWFLYLLLQGLMLFLLHETQFFQDISKNTEQILEKLLLSSLLLNIAMSLSFVRLLYQRKNDIFKDYYFLPTAKAWIHKTNQANRICAKCKVDGKFSLLSLTADQNYFICPYCNSKAPNTPKVIMPIPDGGTIVVHMGKEEKEYKGTFVV